ncbi:MAG: 3-keto-disaccharide hydrolase, partial [Planctomycetia bacterium]
AGYQADFESGDTYSGILYEEKGRGILALRGQSVIVGDDHKPKVAEVFAEGPKLQHGIRKEDWNTYEVSAHGFHFVHKINGVKMAEVKDDDAEKRRKSGLLALQLHAGPPMVVQFRNIKMKPL